MKSMIEGLSRAAARPRLMREMMDRVAVDAEEAAAHGHGLSLALAARRCASCEHEGACATWLAEHERAEHAPSFCANDGFFEAVKSAT